MDFIPMRIFLSYGHDANEELVYRIKTDLENRGHDAWFDKSEIRVGCDWRRSITDGIIASNRVLSFLSNHSTRDPGVCRDEIAIAIGVKGGNIQTILVESEQEVQPPVNISHIQWLDMHDWKDWRDKDNTSWENWYQAKFAEIIRVVESDESRRFAGEIETRNGYLKPIKSDARISQLLNKGFYGRQWLFDAVEHWRNDSNQESRLFWIIGDPGVGKSAFAAQLTHMRGDIVIAAQFVEWDKPDHRNAHRVVRSIAFQLATRLPDYRKFLLTLPEIAELDRKNPADLFDYLLANPLNSAINGGREKYLIVIDALDEAGEAGRNPIVEMLAQNSQRLPAWIGFVVTSRPEFDVMTPFQALNPFPFDTKSEANRADIRYYLQTVLKALLEGRTDTDRLMEQILEKSEGVFLYIERFCSDINSGYLSLDDPEKFPQGVGGIFCQYFQRQFTDEALFERTIEPMLGAILAAREPLPVEILQKLFNFKETALKKWIRNLGSLFPVTTADGVKAIKPYHKSLADWLVDDGNESKYYVSVKEGNALLAEAGMRDIESREMPVSIFWLRHALYHLQQSGRASDAAKVAADDWFIDMRIRSGMKNIFLSYSHDASEIGERLFAELPRFGHTVWRYQNEGTQDILNPVKSADVVIALVSRRSTRMRSWSYKETLEALTDGKIVIPVIATPEEISIPFHLMRPRYINLSTDYTNGLLELNQMLSNPTDKKSCPEDLKNILTPEGELVVRAVRLVGEGRFLEAEPLYRQILANLEQEVKKDSKVIGKLMEDYGQLLFSINRLKDAEEPMRNALAIYENEFGPSHPLVSSVLNNLALLLQSMNRVEEAEQLMLRVLKIESDNDGPQHPRLAVTLNNLAMLLYNSNRLGEAEHLFRQALAINESSYGRDHLQSAAALNNLAMLLQRTNRVAEAEPLLRRALAIEEANYGPQHPTIAASINNLAMLLQSVNRLDEAEPLLRRTLAIYQAPRYGENHPDVAATLNNLADLLMSRNQLAEAEPVIRRALAIEEANYGQNHPGVAANLNKLAMLLHTMNRLAEAEPLYRQALAIREKVLGPSHPDTVANRINLASLLRDKGDEPNSLIRQTT